MNAYYRPAEDLYINLPPVILFSGYFLLSSWIKSPKCFCLSLCWQQFASRGPSCAISQNGRHHVSGSRNLGRHDDLISFKCKTLQQFSIYVPAGETNQTRKSTRFRNIKMVWCPGVWSCLPANCERSEAMVYKQAS